MMWPCLVQCSTCRMLIEVHICGALDEEGVPAEICVYQGACSYQDSVRRVYADQKTYSEATGICLFPGDICPAYEDVSTGYALVFGMKREIAYGRKARNPDGSVNYTEIGLR